MPDQFLLLAGIAFAAGTVTGALGYGFSSITVPLALLWLTNRVLNPALVLIEVVLNAYVVWANRSAVPEVWRRVAPIIAGVGPGVALGTLIISRVNDAALKLGTYLLLIPAILLQAAGYRKPIRAERSLGALVGAGVGTLYAVTTISGPPLAVLLNNQGFTGAGFRASLGLIRLVESTLTACAYAVAGLFIADGLSLLVPLSLGAAAGLPVGARLIRHVKPETFRRVCMSFDAWIVGFGASRVLLHLWPSALALATGLFATVVLIDVGLLAWYFRPTATVPGGTR